MSYVEIDKRYTLLAEGACCLSCGGAVNFSKASPGEYCVDLGSGRGTDAIRLTEEVGEEGFVYGIDISEGMLRKARSTAKKLGIKNVSFHKSTLDKLPVPDNSVDLIISNCTINHAQDKQKVWNEIYRVLKAGGRFVVSDIYALRKVPESFSNDPIAVSECWAGAETRENYLRQITSAGFKQVEILEESEPYRKGKIEVASWTLKGIKSPSCCC